MKLRIQELAQSRGLNISQLHSAVDKLLRDTQRANAAAGEPVSITTIRRYWYGKNPKGTEIDTFNGPILIAIARVLGVNWRELFED